MVQSSWQECPKNKILVPPLKCTFSWTPPKKMVEGLNTRYGGQSRTKNTTKCTRTSCMVQNTQGGWFNLWFPFKTQKGAILRNSPLPEPKKGDRIDLRLSRPPTMSMAQATPSSVPRGNGPDQCVQAACCVSTRSQPQRQGGHTLC